MKKLAIAIAILTITISGVVAVPKWGSHDNERNSGRKISGTHNAVAELDAVIKAQNNKVQESLEKDLREQMAEQFLRI